MNFDLIFKIKNQTFRVNESKEKEMIEFAMNFIFLYEIVVGFSPENPYAKLNNHP